MKTAFVLAWVLLHKMSRPWDANDLLESLMKNYERLPEALQKELPLKRICALVMEE